MIELRDNRAMNALEIAQLGVSAIAVLEGDDVRRRNGPMRFFPDDAVDGFPSALQRQIVVDLAFEIAVSADAFRADRLPELHRYAAPVTLFELRLAHAAAEPTWPPQTFVSRYMARLEAISDTSMIASAKPTSIAARHVLGSLRQAQSSRATIDDMEITIESLRNPFCFLVRIAATQ